MNETKHFMTKCISADMLKWIAVVSMCIDHFAAVVLKGFFYLRIEEIPKEQWHTWELWYEGMRAVGRMAFPLFAFLLVEGFFHTKSRKKYGMRLLAAAVCSEIPYDLAVLGKAVSFERQNTIFTLLLGYLVLNAVWKVRFVVRKSTQEGECGRVSRMKRWYMHPGIAEVLIVAGGCVLACMCRLDYTWKGILLIAVFYFFYGYTSAAAAAGFCVFSGSVYSIFAFLLLFFYDGTKRETDGRKWYRAKYLFYVFYPMHLLILWLILQTAQNILHYT